MLFTLLVVVILIVAILLSLVVLLQSGLGGGLAGIASGGQAQQILGARQAPDFLEKATWVLGIGLIFLCFIAPFTISSERQQRSILQENATGAPIEAPALPSTPTEGAPADSAPAEGATSEGTPAPTGGSDGAAASAEDGGDAPETATE